MLEWFAKTSSVTEMCLLVCGVIVFDQLYLTAILSKFYPQIFIWRKSENLKDVHVVPLLVFAVLLLLAAGVEELIFRYLFLGSCLPAVKENVVFLIFVILFLSAAFGLAHYQKGKVTIPLCLLNQGVSGMMYSIIFLKCGGWAGDLTGLVIATMAHWLSNLLIVLRTVHVPTGDY